MTKPIPAVALIGNEKRINYIIPKFIIRLIMYSKQSIKADFPCNPIITIINPIIRSHFDYLSLRT